MPTPARSRALSAWTLPALVWAATFGVSLLRVHFLNDHFDRISRGRQILAYGDRPFADFRDPGYFLTLYASATAQALTGGSLLGEALLSSAAIATAAAIAFSLARAASASPAAGLAAVAVTWLVPPRYYDYDKVLFYMTGLAVCWRYVDSPGAGRLAMMGGTTALAALFRYDNGLFVLAASLAAIGVNRRAHVRTMVAEAAVYAVVLTAALAPAFIAVQAGAGLAEAFRQIGEYATREGERSELLGVPRLGLDRASAAYVVAAAMIVGSVARLVMRRDSGSLPTAAPKILAGVVLSSSVMLFIVRDPIAARIGAAMPPVLVLGAWASGRWPWRITLPRNAARRVIVPAMSAAVILLAVADGQRFRRITAGASRRLVAVTTGLQTAPASGAYFPEDGALAGMARYLKTCTPGEARVLVAWFAPEVFFFSERGFAGGMAVFLGEHWSSDADQRRTVTQLQSQFVPVAIVEAGSADAFRATFPRVAAYLESHYRVAGVSGFGNPRGSHEAYTILVHRDVRTAATDPEWGLPCLPAKANGPGR